MSGGGHGEGTGVFVVLEDDVVTWSPVQVEVPEWFQFGETNPVSGVPFVESRFGDLPEYAARTVLDRVGLAAQEWDLCVEDGEAADFVDPAEWFPTAGGDVLTRERQPRGGVSGVDGDR